MLILRDRSRLHEVEDPEIRSLLSRRFTMLEEQMEEEGVNEDAGEPLASFVILQDGDALTGFDEVLGFPVLTNRYTGVSFGHDDYTPGFEFIEEHAGCFGIVFVLSDDGYGVEVFIPKTADVDPQLLAMCQQYAIPSREATAP